MSDTNLNELYLSDQALGAVMMALQKSLLEQSDIVPVLKSFKLVNDGDGNLVVTNPPLVKVSHDDVDVISAASEEIVMPREEDP
jgi:hypothetical protein